MFGTPLEHACAANGCESCRRHITLGPRPLPERKPILNPLGHHPGYHEARCACGYWQLTVPVTESPVLTHEVRDGAGGFVSCAEVGEAAL